jgi:predicted acetyltransferase
MQFEVVEATPHERPVLRRLMELYCYDFSQFTGADVNAHGEYEYRWVDHYFTEPDRVPFLITVDGNWAGFALVRTGEVIDMAEFFVMRKYRRTGVGSFAARELFARFEGVWTVREIHANTGATTFWRGAIPYAFEETSTEKELTQHFDSRG